MIGSLKKLFSPPATTRTLKLRAATLIRGNHYDAGSTVTVDEATAASLLADGTGTDPAGDAAAGEELERLRSKLPAPRTAQPMPPGWKDLPQCFMDWWTLNESALGVLYRRDEIERRLVDLATRNTMKHDLRSTLNNIPEGDRKIALIAGIAAAVEIGVPDPDRLRELRFLEDAYLRASSAVDDWRAAHSEALIRAKIECGDHLQVEHEIVCKSVALLHANAYDLFKTRVAALGLGDIQTRRLFTGSADAVRVSSFISPTLEDLRVAWSEEDGTTRLFVDKPPKHMGELIFKWKTLRDEAAELGGQILLDLQKARKAAA